jgi:hypothetical protein
LEFQDAGTAKWGLTKGTGNDFFIYNYGTSSSAVEISPAGNVGVGITSASYTLQVNGSVAGTSAYVNTSDKRLKNNIQDLDAGLNEVMQLKPVRFEWADAAFVRYGKQRPLTACERRAADPAMQGKQIGFIAQDVEKVLPSVVVTEPNADKTKVWPSSEQIPVLVKAVQELKTENDALRADVETLKATRD